jgi:hypothetical protein
VDCAQGKLRKHDHLRSNLETAGHKSYRTDAPQAEFAANRWNKNIRSLGRGWNRCTPDNATDKANPSSTPSAPQKIGRVQVSSLRHSTTSSQSDKSLAESNIGEVVCYESVISE